MTLEEFLVDYEKLKSRGIKLTWILFYVMSLFTCYRFGFKKGQEDAFIQFMEYLKQKGGPEQAPEGSQGKLESPTDGEPGNPSHPVPDLRM